jgi:hypothetical protein
MKKIMILIALCTVLVMSQTSTRFSLKSDYFYKTNDFIYPPKNDTVNVSSTVSFLENETIVIQNKYQATQYKVLSSQNVDNNIVIHTIRLDRNAPYNIIMSSNTVELVNTSGKDSIRVVFVLNLKKAIYFNKGF